MTTSNSFNSGFTTSLLKRSLLVALVSFAAVRDLLVPVGFPNHHDHTTQGSTRAKLRPFQDYSFRNLNKKYTIK